MEPPETLRHTVPLKDIKPWRSRAQVGGTKRLSMVRMEFVVELGLLCGEVDSLLPAQPSRKHLGSKLEASERHAKHSKSAAAAGTVRSTPGGWGWGRGW